ncbi:MAG: branched-chain amino acid ABC transporter permease [Vulcanimicrobiaceae bacterium]
MKKQLTPDLPPILEAQTPPPASARARPRSRAQSTGSPRALLIAVVAVAALLPLVLQRLNGQVYWLFVVAEFFIYAIVAISLDLLMGRTGQISLGQSGFFAVGAYTAAVLNVHTGTGMLAATFAGGLVAAVASLVLGFPAARLRGHYLGIVTFGYGIAVDQIALKWDALTGGDQGLHLHPATLLGINVGAPIRMYYVALVGLLAATLLVWKLTRTRLGRSFAAVKDSEIAAAAMGIPVARTKVIAFLFSAFLAGVAGGLYAFLNGFIAPGDFGIDLALLFFAMVVIGGMGSLPGAIGGALIVFSVQQAASTISGLSLAILGAVIVVTALFVPNGLRAVFKRLRWGRQAAPC